MSQSSIRPAAEKGFPEIRFFQQMDLPGSPYILSGLLAFVMLTRVKIKPIPPKSTLV